MTNSYVPSPDAGSAPQLTGKAKDAQRRAEHGRDNAMHGAKAQPAPNRQIDGTPTNMGTKPTRASLQDRTSSPSVGRTGMETAMGALADKLHPRTFKGRR